MNKGDKLIVSALSTINVGFRVNGKWRMTLQDTNGTDFKEYTWEAPEKITVTEMGIMPYTKFGELYVRSVQILAQTKISVSQLEQGFAFDSQAKVFAKTSCAAGIKSSYDAEKNAMLIKPSEKNKAASINVDTFTLNAGDKIVVKVWCLISSGTNASFVTTTADGKKSHTNIYANTGFQEYEYTAKAECTVTDLQIIPYTASGELYVQSVRIVRAA